MCLSRCTWYNLKCNLVSGVFKVGVCPNLPIKGVNFIMGNDIAGGRVLPILEVSDCPEAEDELAEFPWGFSSVCFYTGAVPTVE